MKLYKNPVVDHFVAFGTMEFDDFKDLSTQDLYDIIIHLKDKIMDLKSDVDYLERKLNE